MRRLRILIAVLCSVAAVAAVPEPKEHFGFSPGDDNKLVDYSELIGYFQKLQSSSDRIKLVTFGKTSMGKPMYMAFLSDGANLAKLDHYRGISRKLALGQGSREEAQKLSVDGKAIVWIDSGLHASEVAPSQQAPHLAYRMVTGEDEETRRIRKNVILIQIPCINPDGLDWVAHWHRKNVGSPYAGAPLPHLYHKYAGHDNNRDWYMLNLEETRHVTRQLFQEWFPQIVYNQHQAPPFPARIFVPPYAEPLNPNIPAPVMEGINLIGAAMKERFARENKPGILSYWGFDAWWNGGLRSVPAFHNMHGILTETAGSGAAPRNTALRDLPERFGNGMPAREPSVFYQRPWMGGRWGMREAVDYMLTADFAILDLAASRPSHFLFKAWELATVNMELGRKGKPYAYVVPMDQGDKYTAMEMVRRLSMAGITVQRAKSAFTIGAKQYPAGTLVMPAGQPFRPYLVDLMEPQKYPEIKTGQTGPTKRPYDVAGWTLPMMMGVQVDRIEERFEAALDNDPDLRLPAPSLDRRDNSSFLATIDLLKQGVKVRWGVDGALLAEGKAPAAEFQKAAYELRAPRVALYEPYTANMDAGWTQWLLDYFRVPYTMVRNGDFQNGSLRAKYDTIILASQTAQSILHGTREGETSTGRSGQTDSRQRPEYTGGITLAGLAAIDEFVKAGGTLICFDTATELPVQFFPLPVTARIRAAAATGDGAESSNNSGFYSPGSVLRMTVENGSPLTAGMPRDAHLFTTGGQAWDINLMSEFNKGDRETKAVVRYASKDLLASGWLSGERTITGKAALVQARHGQGQVVLFGFRPQFRGQTFGTFKLVLNAIYLGSAKKL
ncbi:MAG: peptidase M14 [Acidobacteria bacterium]|nr:peptidase M14 [Acidobacteriota bacterium]